MAAEAVTTRHSFDANDRASIIELLHAYTFAVDDGDFDGVARLFEHATFFGIGDKRPLTGAEVAEKFKSILILYEDGTPRTQHRISNISISFDQATGGAKSSCYVEVIQQAPGHPLELIVAARYDDAFEIVDDRWRFARRVASRHFYGDLVRHNRMSLKASSETAARGG